MKNIAKRSLSVILSLVLCFGFVFGINMPAQAATVNYVYSGSYIYNWGTRGEVATFLSPNAEDFYQDNQTSYSSLAALSGSSTVSGVPSSALYKELHTLMKSNHSYTTSYNATRDLFQYTDCQNSGKTSTKISSFYSGKEIGPAWDSGSTWNREHVWPNSKSNGGSNTNTKRETDIMMLRPTSTKENGSRGNKAYGASSGYYNPNSESNGTLDLRGDVARIILFVYVRWGGDDTYSDGALNYMWGSSGVFESKEVLIDWMEADPVDTWELGRNDSTEAITGTRNVFVDYPELAFILFGEQVPSNYTTPSGNAKNNSTSSTPSTGGNTTSSSTQSGTQSSTQTGNQSSSQTTTQGSTSSSTSGNTQTGSQTNTSSSSQTSGSQGSSTTCTHAGAYKVAAEEVRCETEGYTEGKYCPDCKTYISGHKLIEATGHTYAGDCDTECDVCGKTRELEDAAQHNFDDDGICTVCGASNTDSGNTKTDSDTTNEDDALSTDADTKTPEKSGFPWWIVIAIAVVIIAGGVVVIIIFREKIWPKKTEEIDGNQPTE